MVRICELLLVAVFVAGCSGRPSTPAPTTHPAKGSIADASGKPLSGGMIDLASADGATKRASGEVGADGSFELAVMDIEGNKHAGAEEGEYSVTYVPVMTAAQTEAPVQLPGKVKIQPGENTLELKLP
jgi:hypothetical protein